MSLQEVGAYVYLLASSWSSNCSLPDEDDYLARVSRMGPAWDVSKKRIKERFTLKKGRLYPKFLITLFKEASENSDSKSNGAVKRWSREKYFESELTSYTELLHNEQWVQEQQKFHPYLDIRLSIEKAHTQFWSTEEGFNHFKNKKSKSKNWKKTFQDSLSLEINQVKKQRSTQNVGTGKTGLSSYHRKHAGEPGYDASGNAIGAQAKPGEFDEGIRTLEGVKSL
jgi:uncharacterized protein YdaU (DUF1376 family)